jgi:hypothetical protein
MSFLVYLREILHKSFLALPLLLAGFTLFMGLTQGNMGLLILFFGFATVVPISASLLNLVWEYFFSESEKKSLFSVPFSDVCQLILSAPKGDRNIIWVAPSYWMALITFFFSYLATNAVSIYTMKAEEDAAPDKVENRKSQAFTALLLSIFVFFILVSIRFFVTKCETPVGILTALVLGGSLGIGWYHFARFCHARDADIFGIVQGIIPKNMEFAVPLTCVYQANGAGGSK